METFHHLMMLTALLAAPAAAQTEGDARQAAESVLGKHALQQVALDTRAKAKAITADGAANVFAYNAADGGFAIVCTGGGRTAVAGYSTTGSLSADRLPDGMKAWLSAYSKAMAATTADADDEYNARWEGPTIPVYTCTYPLAGNFEFHTRYHTPDGERTTLAPKEYFRKDPYAAANIYRVNAGANDFSNGLWCLFGSARTANAANGIDITLKHPGEAKSDCIVKGIFLNVDEGLVTIDSVSNLSATAGGTLACTLRPQLKAGTRYEALLLFNSGDKWFAKDRTWSYVLNDDRTVATFTIAADGTTGIGTTTAFLASTFTEGETVTAYDLSGRALLSLPFSARFWADIEARLPHDTFVLGLCTIEAFTRNIPAMHRAAHWSYALVRDSRPWRNARHGATGGCRQTLRAISHARCPRPSLLSARCGRHLVR